ncbi:hypothetical protein [Streptodolium elevatio]|uniref:Uncharacterized protein n=1 Tax=Streptodolium elevatio TaxID=3157996 RepID=A0ABV3DPV3_9ACTN
MPGYHQMSAGDTVHLAWGTSIVSAVVGPDAVARHGVGPVDILVPPRQVYAAGDGHLIVVHRAQYRDGGTSEWSLPTRTLVDTQTADATPGRLRYPDGRQVYLADAIDTAALGPGAALHVSGPFAPGDVLDVAWIAFEPGGAVRTTHWRGEATQASPAPEAVVPAPEAVVPAPEAVVPVPVATLTWAAGHHVQFRHSITRAADGWTRLFPSIALVVAAR